MIEEYLIERASTCIEMERRINALIEMGYVPQGGICYDSGAASPFIQAMVKFGKPQEPSE